MYVLILCVSCILWLFLSNNFFDVLWCRMGCAMYLTSFFVFFLFIVLHVLCILFIWETYLCFYFVHFFLKYSIVKRNNVICKHILMLWLQQILHTTSKVANKLWGLQAWWWQTMVRKKAFQKSRTKKKAEKNFKICVLTVLKVLHKLVALYYLLLML